MDLRRPLIGGALVLAPLGGCLDEGGDGPEEDTTGADGQLQDAEGGDLGPGVELPPNEDAGLPELPPLDTTPWDTEPEDTYVAPDEGPEDTYVAPDEGPEDTYVAPDEGPEDTYVAPDEGPEDTYVAPDEGTEDTYVAPDVPGEDTGPVDPCAKAKGSHGEPCEDYGYGVAICHEGNLHLGCDGTTWKTPDEIDFGFGCDCWEQACGPDQFGCAVPGFVGIDRAGRAR